MAKAEHAKSSHGLIRSREKLAGSDASTIGFNDGDTFGLLRGGLPKSSDLHRTSSPESL